MGQLLQSTDEIVREIMRIHRSLPARPAIDDVEAAVTLVRNVEKEEQTRIEGITKQKKGNDVPEELFFVLQEMKKNLVLYQCKEQKREAAKLLDLELVHNIFDELIQRASGCLPLSSSNGSATSASISSSIATTDTHSNRSQVFSTFYADKEVGRSLDNYTTKDDIHLKRAKPSIFSVDSIIGEPIISPPSMVNSILKAPATSGESNDKLSLIKLASLIEVSSKNGAKELNLQGKLMDQIEWLPDSIRKLSNLITLDVSENQVRVIPETIGALSCLTRLDLHSNRLSELPDSIGDIFGLQYLDLRGNQLSVLPASLGRLVNLLELDVSSNKISVVSDGIGNLIKLRKLILETNDLEELPHTVGHCSSLIELRADYNRLKGLPEAIGRLQSLEVLSVRYNNIKGLPTTMASLSKLRDIDASFNELESIPESIGLVTTLVRLNISSNFADLKSLPRSIGNLEMLEELDISNNQIRVLPDSFGMLSLLRVLRAEENPWELPPRNIIEQGAEAVVHYMAEYVAKREVNTQSVRPKKAWYNFCFFIKSKKRKHDGSNYIKS